MDVAHDIEPARIAKIRRETFERMIAAGCFRGDERIQLLEGVLVQMPPQGDPHVRTIVRLNNMLAVRFAGRADVAPQVGFPASEYSRPEPDLALWPLAPANAPPPARPLLVIEVSDTTLRLDRRVKVPIYGSAGISEYWIINLQQICVERHTQPQPGGYRLVETLSPGATIRLVEFSDVEISVADLLAAVIDPDARPA